MEREFGVKATLRDGPHGIFEVSMDGRIIYTSKNRPGQLPSKGEIFSIIYGEV
jgi:hypothetical protein